MIIFPSELELHKFLMKESSTLVDLFGMQNYTSEVKIGNYGRADIVGAISDNDEDPTKILYTVIELKNRILEPKDLVQLARYMKGLKRQCKKKEIDCKVNGALIGVFDKASDLMYASSAFDNLSIFGYEICPHDGFQITDMSEYSLIKEGFKDE